MVIGSFIFGFDHDDDAVFERTVRFCEKNKIDLPIFFILTPVPGTRLFKRMEEEGRILHKDWSKYNGSNVVFKPKLLSEQTLFNGYNWAFQESYSHHSIAKRILFPPHKRMIPELLINYAFRRMVLRAPKGKVTIVSKLLNTLNTSIPIKDKKNLVPTFVDTTVEKSQQLIKDASEILKVKATHNERFRTLIIKLEGSLDFSSAKQLIKRLKGSLTKEHLKIIIDFNGIKHLSPKAAKLLIMKNVEKLSAKRKQIEVRNFEQIANGAFTNITNLISDSEPPGQQRMPSQEIDSQTIHDHLETSHKETRADLS
jgi:anti-anti-sigma regulatory factor